MDPKTPDRAKGTRNLHDTPLAPITSNGPPHGFKVAKDALDAVRAELKSCTASIGKKVDDNGLDELYARLEIKDDYIESLLATHSLKAEYEGGRWKRIPVKVQDEKDLYAPLTVLFNKLFHFFEADGKFGSGTRSFIVTASKMQWHDDASTPHDPLAAARVGTMPDFLVVGQDDSQLPHPLEESITHEEYRRTIVIGDAKKKKEGRAESQEDRAQVVSYGRQCFLQQANRRFVYLFLITEDRFRLMVLDHSGLLQYPWVDYHANPENFVKFAYLIAGCNLDHMGFDPSIFYEEAANGTFERFINVTTIKPPPLLQGDKAVTEIETPSFHEHKFRITKISHREQAVRGAGSFWWDAEEVGTKDVVEVTIKDYWRNLDRQHEAEFLREAERKGVEGVIRLRIAQYEPLDPQEKITTANARGLLIEDMRSKDGTPFIDMIHTRIVTERQVPITQFQNGLQLIHALTDALSAHRSLLEDLKLLHRNISIYTILLGKPGSQKGRRGLLGDLSMSVRIPRGPNDTLAERDIRVVAQTFLSDNLLNSDPPNGPEIHPRRAHNFLDDLQSKFWTLFWIMAEYDGPNLHVKVRSNKLISFESNVPSKSMEAKVVLLSRGSGVVRKLENGVGELAPYFYQPPFITLFKEVCAMMNKLSGERCPDETVTPSDEERSFIYDEMLGYFHKAIGALTVKPTKKGDGSGEKEKAGETHNDPSGNQLKPSAPVLAEEAAGSASAKAPEVKRTRKKVVILDDTVTTIRRTSVRIQFKKSLEDKAEMSGPGEKRKQGPGDDDDVEGMLKKTKTQSSE